MRVLIATAAAAILAGCATAYQPNGLTGGFSETKLSQNVYRISFQGNGFNRPEQASEMSLLRAAELMQESGYPFFIVMDERTRTDYTAITSPVQARTTGRIDPYSNTFNATTSYSGGGTTMIQSPTATTTIMGFKEDPKNGNLVYEARQIYDSLAPKYKK